MTKKILLIDANAPGDEATEIIYKRRSKVLYPYVDGSKYKSLQVRLIEKDDIREKVKQALLDTDLGYVTASGHGRESYLTGWAPKDQPFPEVLKVDNYNPDEARGKIFHLFACHTGHTLGKDLVAKGAKAFFGYKDSYAILTRAQYEFCDSDIAIDQALIAGNTAEQTHTLAIKAFDDRVKRFRADGDEVAAANLERNRNLLVSPVTDRSYGDLQAKIETGL